DPNVVNLLAMIQASRGRSAEPSPALTGSWELLRAHLRALGGQVVEHDRQALVDLVTGVGGPGRRRTLVSNDCASHGLDSADRLDVWGTREVPITPGLSQSTQRFILVVGVHTRSTRGVSSNFLLASPLPTC